MLHHFADGRLRVYYKERLLSVTAYGTYPAPDPAEDEKTLDLRFEAIVAARQKRASLAMAEARVMAGSPGCCPVCRGRWGSGRSGAR